jgi:cell division septation protein DedD
MLGGRGGRSDDWSSPHLRARARLAERLDGPLDVDEARWLDAHLADCAECETAARDYAAQRLQLRALREQAPVPPRDLWARTSASIEREARHRTTSSGPRSRRALLAPYALLAGALVVAVIVGSLSSFRQPDHAATTASASQPNVAVASPSSAGPTSIAVAPQDVAYLSQQNGNWKINHAQVDRVCQNEAGSCATTQPNETTSIGPLASPASVFGSDEGPLVIVGDTAGGSSVYALTIPESSPTASPPPSISPSPTPSAATESPSPTPTPSEPVESQPAESPSVSPSPTPSSTTEPPHGAVEIARGVQVVNATAAYSPDGTEFAFTARPADGSQGPDIYFWRVGQPQALPVTIDHHSVFGSWAGGTIVGSTVTLGADGLTNEPLAFTLAPDTLVETPLPQAGLAWRPAVDPTNRSAVYWAGTLQPTADGAGWTTVAGRLVLGRWSAGTTEVSPSASPSAGPTKLTGDQAIERSETTLATGPITDWDARWDETGTRLAVWIADATDPKIGRLSLYVVDPFDGRINLENPPLRDEVALAGFSIADSRLAWAAPAAESPASRRVQILAWTDAGFGQVESAAGDFLLVR